MSKFTPGKWCCDKLPRNIDRAIPVVTPNAIIAYVVGCKNDEANARLIAAAPDIYAFVKTVYELFTNPDADEEGLSMRFIPEAAKQILSLVDGKEGEP